MASLLVKEIPASRLTIKMVDKRKRDCGKNTANAGYFGTYSEGGDLFTLPAGHLVCDFEAENRYTKHYCQERGRFNGSKYHFDNSKFTYDDPLCGKALSTLVIRGGEAVVVDTKTLPDCDYAISGVPVMRNGADCNWVTYVKKQGWVASNVRATWHTFVGVKDDPKTVYLMAMQTTTSNMVTSSEAYKAFKAIGFRDVLKMDGGGSFYYDADGKRTQTSENRRINTIFAFEETKERNDGDMFKIALGAGHGAKTAGKRCLKALDPKETPEWVLNDRIADKVETLLKGYDGYQLLRLDDSDDGAEDIALAERVSAANDWDADFYLSIHHNAGINGGAGGGIVAYAYTKAQKASLEWRDELYEELVKRTGLKGNRATPKATANHYVTRMTTMPATLLELGFMDSKTDVPIILTEEYADQCAAAIVAVIVRRAGLKAKEQPTDQADSWAASAWLQAKNAGVLDGTRPRDAVSRQELAVILDRLGLV